MAKLKRYKVGDKITVDFLRNVSPEDRNQIKYDNFDEVVGYCERCPDNEKYWRTVTPEEFSRYWRHVKNRSHFSHDANVRKVLFYENDVLINVENYDENGCFTANEDLSETKRGDQLIKVNINL